MDFAGPAALKEPIKGSVLRQTAQFTMAKIILAVGIDVPGGYIESEDIVSDRSLLDADIVVFQPGIPVRYGRLETYLGKRCLDDDSSFRLREAFKHWRRELSAAVEAGKIVFLVLSAPDTVYVGTGEKEYSGTGRNARTTRMVEPMTSYEAVPVNWSFQGTTGSEMMLLPEARLLAPYWDQLVITPGTAYSSRATVCHSYEQKAAIALWA